MGKVTIEINAEGIGELLRSDGVQAMLMQRAEKAAAAARSEGLTVADDEPLPVGVVDGRSGTRARALVTIDHPAGIAVEAKHRVLGRSIQSAK